MCEDIIDRINIAKKERDATILAHFYQPPEIQDIADFIGDSLELSRKAATINTEVIVFCGVHFMAQTAFILSPNKTVLLPRLEAGCPMADMVRPDDILTLKERYPNSLVVSYVNTTAEVKAVSDICCTSSNAVKIIESLPHDRKIIFVPDKNLGSYIMNKTKREMILWNGYCPIHQYLTLSDIASAKKRHPNAEILVHPECSPEVIGIVDFVGSTGNMIAYVQQSKSQEFIIGTEIGIIHEMKRLCPAKEFYLASEKLFCPDMKYISLNDILQSLETMSPKVMVDKDICAKALKPIKRMLAL